MALEPDAQELLPRHFQVLSGLIHEATGVRLGAEKRELLASRLRPLLAQLEVPTFARLVSVVSADPSGEKLALLIDRATTNTTGFFRHKVHFDLLRAALPRLARERQRVRVWCAGCSTGEEPYSVALLLLASGYAKDARILGTDVSRRALVRARTATYDEDAIGAVPQHLRNRFDHLSDGRWRVGEEVRALVTLRHHDLREASAGARAVFDAIFCRNVLIYFEARARAAAVERLARVLRPGGLFFLGPSESGVELPAAFARIGPAAYKKG